MTALPFVNCICPTYGRPPDHQHLLEEAVESFLRQDYPADRRRLIVFNDCAEQELGLTPGIAYGRSLKEVPDLLEDNYEALETVRFVNARHRYATLGAKLNAAINMLRPWADDLIAPWEDDDISLPHRLSQAVAMLGDADYWKPPQVVFRNGSGPMVVKHAVGVRHHASVFRRTAWAAVGGYPPCSGSQDALMDEALTRCACGRGRAPEGDLPSAAWAYIYRWGVSPVHLSGVAEPGSVTVEQIAALREWLDDVPGLPFAGLASTDAACRRLLQHDPFYAAVGRRLVQEGRFELRPRWREDYVALCRP